MTFESLTLLDGVVQLRLKGRLDLAGIQSINDNFTLATTREGKFIVDLSDVSFLTSVGIRMLLISPGRRSVAVGE